MLVMLHQSNQTIHIPTANMIPSGEHTKSNGKSPFLMGKSTISMAIFNCYVSSPEGISSPFLVLDRCIGKGVSILHAA